MKIILLDGVGAGFFYIAIGLGILFIILAIYIEAAIMKGMKYHDGIKKAAGQSLVANLVSLVAGFIFISSSDLFQIDNTAGLLLLLLITFVLEWLVLFLMNRDKPVVQTLSVTAVMNLVTYGIAFLFIKIAGS